MCILYSKNRSNTTRRSQDEVNIMIWSELIVAAHSISCFIVSPSVHSVTRQPNSQLFNDDPGRELPPFKGLLFSRRSSWMTALETAFSAAAAIDFREYTDCQRFRINATFDHPHARRERFPVQLRVQKLWNLMQNLPYLSTSDNRANIIDILSRVCCAALIRSVSFEDMMDERWWADVRIGRPQMAITAQIFT